MEAINHNDLVVYTVNLSTYECVHHSVVCPIIELLVLTAPDFASLVSSPSLQLSSLAVRITLSRITLSALFVLQATIAAVKDWERD